jgi:aerobic-type carbon monoxide dehydrogenase small subunit (CoxS/CutS family)
MPEEIVVNVNGHPLAVPAHSTVAVAVLLSGFPSRKSVTGQLRGAMCGMGICFECRVTIDGKPHGRSCQILCEAGMKVTTE